MHHFHAIALFIFSLSFIAPAMTQSAFIVDEYGSIYNVNIANCTFTSTCINTNLQSIAYYNGDIYGTSSVGSTNALYKLDISTCISTVINSNTPSADINGLVSDGTGNFYAAISGDGTIYKYDLNQNSWSSVGSISPYTSAGDLTFYNGKLFLVALGTPNKLIEITLNPFSFTVVGDIGTTSNMIWGIITSFTPGSCTGSVFAMVQNGNSVTIGTVNPATAIVTPLCPDIFSGTIYDATSPEESGGLNLSIIADPDSICENGTTLLTADAGFSTYVWAGSNLNSNSGISVTASPTSTTTYSVTATDSSGLCTSTSQIVVYVNPTPIIQVTAKDVCSGYSSMLIATGASSYMWSDGLGSQDTVFTPALYQNTTYSVTGTSLGCSTSESVSVVVNQHLDDFYYQPLNPAIGNPVQFTPTSQNSTLWSWDFDNGSTSSEHFPNTTFLAEGIYNVVLISYSGGCYDTIVKQIEIIPDLEYFVPNVFTPNNDGSNDSFGPIISGHKTFEMSIFNRWGKKIFETNSIDVLWDGTIENNQLASEGVYYYTIIIGQYQGDNITLSGSVSLYRNQ